MSGNEIGTIEGQVENGELNPLAGDAGRYPGVEIPVVENNGEQSTSAASNKFAKLSTADDGGKKYTGIPVTLEGRVSKEEFKYSVDITYGEIWERTLSDKHKGKFPFSNN